ncbi:MAG: hypothetical protein Q8862_03270 [Bacteroidota bacterium]|nr:hypothetical protein [Bacteroidota bacterium]MDP4205902.1 hypothetical protein [Bacteroidota bacterium]
MLIKRILKFFFRFLPLYKRTRKEILGNGTTDEQKFCQLIDHCLSTVPVYRDYFREAIAKGTPVLFNDFPIVRKKEIIGKEEQFISDKYSKKNLIRNATGGSTGISVNFYASVREIIKVTAYADYAFSLIGERESLRIATLRGIYPRHRISCWYWGQLVLSSYDLTPENIPRYIKLIEKHKINCLHVYPSSIRIFCKYVKEMGLSGKLRHIRGILSSSETLSQEDKNLILELFPAATLVDLYGQSEHVAFAISVNRGPYRFLRSFGIPEFIDTEMRCKDHRICEIVATSLINKAMPLIRYGIEDFVVIDSKGEVRSILGRSQDFLIGKNEEILPCLVVYDHDTMINVISYQYFQEKAGEVELRIKANNCFGEKDRSMLIRDLLTTFDDKISVRIKVVKEMEKTRAGKQIRVIQCLNIWNYLNSATESLTGTHKDIESAGSSI